jgi:ElaB/YqjD/DUF883 family membrane-anchored ribosome-binding protein
VTYVRLRAPSEAATKSVGFARPGAGTPNAPAERMTQPTARKKTSNSGKADDLMSTISNDASDAAEAIEERGAELFEKVKATGNDMFRKAKDTGSEQLDKVRDFIVANPFQCVVGGIAFGLLMRSWLRGPTTTLVMMGGAAYLGFRYAGERSAQTER